MNTRIAIIGGGIGGLGAALSLLSAGFDVHVYEQARALREVGAGIQISPNAARVIHGLGLGDELAKFGVRPLSFRQRRWQDGRTLINAPLGDTVVSALGYAYYHVHRSDLLAMLTRALPAERLHVGHRLVGFADHGDHIEAEFASGDRIVADALVGADGIHSAARRLLFGPAHPRFTGCVAYRGLVPAERVAHLGLEVSAQMWIGPGKHLIIYYVAGKRLLNFVANIDQNDWTKESWTDQGDVNELRAAFADWDPNLRTVVDAIDETFVLALHDRAPLPHWSVGRATLLGDACHPMLPFMAQGASQALEDGASLAACLTAAGDVAEGFARYEKMRLPRTAHIQGMAGANKTRFHLPDGPAQEERDSQMATGGTDWSLKAISWIYGYDAAGAVKTGNLGLPS